MRGTHGKRSHGHDGQAPTAAEPMQVPGKRTLVDAQIMRQASGTAAMGGDASAAQRAFGAATSGPASAVPYRADMERAFGEDFSGVRAHLGGSTRTGLDALNANAAAQSETIAFGTATPDKQLVAHELTHVVQQRRGGSGVQNKGAVSAPSDHAEREADEIAPRAAAGERVTVGGSASAGAIHRDIKDTSAKVPLGEFSIDMTKFEGAAGDDVGETGTVSFKPNAKAPDSTSIRLTQVAKTVDLPSKVDHVYSGVGNNRNKMETKDKDEAYTTKASDTLKSIALEFYGDPSRTKEIYDANKAKLSSDKPEDAITAGIALTIPKSIVGGNFVDHLPSDPKAKPRTAKTDANVPQDYVWPGEVNPPKNRHGSKAGTTIVPASLNDTPHWNKALGYRFETIARSDDTGIYYGTMHWSFKIHDTPGKVTEEAHHVTEGVSHTAKGAIGEFNKFYKNTYTVMKGDTLASIAERYLGSAAKADDIYNANTALIADKANLKVGIQLVIPGISPT